MRRKTCKQYFLSVEGETEKWYFEHLQKLINNEESLPFKVNFDIKIKKSIISSVKSISAIGSEIKAFHICDYESNDQVHVEQFKDILMQLKEVKKIKKNIKYKLGYSNFSFDLWIILHKRQQISPVSHIKNYVDGINKAYNEKFQFIDDYKEKKNFQRILSKIELNDVIFAIKNGNEIRIKNEKYSDKRKQYGDFTYYIDNPDMTVNNCVEQILKECKVIEK